MPALIFAFATAGALGAGAWLAMAGAVLLTDALAAFEIHDPRSGIAAARQGIGGLAAGLVLFAAGALAFARVLW